MRIRSKLLFVAMGSQLMLLAAVGVYFMVMAPIAGYQAENALFQAAARQARNLQVETNRLGTNTIANQIPVFESALADFNRSLDDIGAITILPAINETLLGAVEAVATLRMLSMDAVKSVKSSLKPLKEIIVDLQLSTDPDLPAIIVMGNGPGVDPNLKNLAQSQIATLTKNLRNANEALATMVTVISQQDSIVAEEIAAITSRSLALALAVIGVALVAVLVLSLLMAADIARALGRLSRTVTVMSQGDFTTRFGLVRRDEIGVLADDLDHLLEALNTSLGQIKGASDRNRRMRDDLLRISGESSSSAVEIRTNTESISTQMERVDRMVTAAGAEVLAMTGAINAFHGRLGRQNQQVAESVGSVTRMLEAIETIERITARDLRAAEELVRESEHSRDVFEQAFEKVAEITDSVSAIQEMASVIAGIASQTNILAMNAAIEAAHAGDFGKGFAVVANEIGKLATASAASSEEIAHTIAAIVIKMNEAGSTRSSTSEAFNRISAQIQGVSGSIGEIHGNVSGMQAGSRRILAVMEDLRTSSTGVMDESARIEQTTKEIQLAMGDLGRISHEVTANIGEIAVGVQLISASVQSVFEHTDQLGVIATDLDGAVSVFHTVRVDELPLIL